MMATLKFWKWFSRKKKIGITKEEIYKFYPAKDMALVTTESDLKLSPCKISNDHFMTVKGSKKRQRRIMMNPQILTIPVWDILPGWKFKLILARLLFPRYLRFRTYTIRNEGEVTHDPHDDNFDQADKMKFEKMLFLEGKFAAANAGAKVYEGMKGDKKWYDYIPFIVICIIVIAFLFAFQIAPNV